MSTFLSTLADDFALVLGGQGSAWRNALDESLALPTQGQKLREAHQRARKRLSAVAVDLLTHAPGATERIDAIVASEAADAANDSRPAVSVPGIVLAQLGALYDLDGSGLNLRTTHPQTVLGHSQGVLGVALTAAHIANDEDGIEQVLTLAHLIGVAAEHEALRLEARPRAGVTPMLSVRGPSRTLLDEALASCDGVTIAVVNGSHAHVLSGRPSDLETAHDTISGHVRQHNQGVESHLHGGSPVELTVDFLPVGAPFHSPLLTEAVGLVDTWVARLNAHGAGIDAELAHDVASQILVTPADWAGTVSAALTSGVTWFLDLGPTPMVGQLTAPLVAGSGSGVVDASTRAGRTSLDLPGTEVPAPVSWSSFAPRLLRLPDGTTVVDTAFTRLTGKSPIILPGMTPTTVWPEIVAAAANAGNWAELAGGGQYSEEVFTENRSALAELLEPGRTAAFNTMFFDRFMWNLQFGVNRIVPKARRAGAPIDAVTIAAGVPERDEATDLFAQLKADGFSFVCLKPGTVEQIHQCLDIADQNPELPLILQVEDGHSGGHHSWEDLDDLLLATYARIRATPSVVLAVGGGIGTPEDAVRYVSGRWALAYGRPLMPVDAVLVGTAAMATLEARTSPHVKKLLMDTPGVSGDGWVGRGQCVGGMTSGLSHLDADMHEIDNSSSRASRLIHELGGDISAINERREELIDALGRTAKPYFGDVEQMTYAQWARRIVDLSYPWADWTWTDRVLDVFHRIEARLSDSDHGEIPTLFADRSSLEDGPAALDKLCASYPQAETTMVAPVDAAWFPHLCRKHHKPMPFVPVLDSDLARWWGTDTLWQSHDERFDADAVRIIPGPRSVAGIDRINEPVGELFARFEKAIVSDLMESHAPISPACSRLGNAEDVEAYLRLVPTIQWAGNLVANPAYTMPEQTSIRSDEGDEGIRVHCETSWGSYEADPPHAVREIFIPLLLPDSCATGGVPVVDMERLSVCAYDLLAGAAGVGTTTVNGDRIEQMPHVIPDEAFGTVVDHFTLSANLGRAHGAVTGAAVDAEIAPIVPDALVGPCWPAIYAALGSAIHDGIPVIEGLVNAVHLEHTLLLSASIPEAGTRVEVRSRCAELSESSAGRLVRVEVELHANGTLFAQLTERFAIRGRVASTQPPAPAYDPAAHTTDTPRSVLRQTTVKAPADMTAFAHVSGDFNPIHTSAAAAGLSGLHAPLVHGMWLSATAQHLIEASHLHDSDTPALEISQWSYQMHGMVDLNDDVEITVERVGRSNTHLAVEATCRVNGDVVSLGKALVKQPATAYVYPGQGIQRRGMGFDDMSATMRQIWARADAHTRKNLGFSIEAIVRDNPTQIRVGERIFRHPDGVLSLTQFTQVALATLAYAQTQDLKDRGLFAEGSVYAGHSLGEYNALACCAGIFPLETVLDIVHQRGSAMHDLVERDKDGHSNYRLGALRPDQIGVNAEQVSSYVDSVASECGEFLQIVNHNLEGSQYAVAGTVAGLAALEKDAQARADARGRKRPFILIPGIDVPFHSSRLHNGVAPFRATLDSLIPERIDLSALVGRYIPNLVARPFEVSESFARSILDVAPSEAVRALVDDWPQAAADEERTGRTLLVELLAWQFASPVRWIETQNLLFDPVTEGGMGVKRLVEIGLASAPTLANLADKTLHMPRHRGHRVEVMNCERDALRLRYEDVNTAVVTSEPVPAPSHDTQAPQPVPDTPTRTPHPEEVAPAAPSSSASQARFGADVPDLPLRACDAVRILLAHANKVRPEQIEGSDTVDSLTNGVSSKRNQLLMDMAAELSVPSIDGAAEATISTLLPTVETSAGTYTAFGPVLGEAISARLRKLLGGTGLAPSYVPSRVTDTWELGQGWANHVSAEILLGTREGDSVRGGALGSLPSTVASAEEVNALVDAAVQAVASRHDLTVSLPGGGGHEGGELVDSAALTALTERILGADGILATQARDLLAHLGLDVQPKADASEDLSDVVEALTSELGAGWVDSVAPRFHPERAVLLDDRWASAREDLVRLVSGQLDPSDVNVTTFRGGGSSLADLASWCADHTSGQTRKVITSIYEAAHEPADGAFSDDVALVTGAAPNSIAAAVVARLLSGGATVIMTSSRVDDARLAFAKELYRRHGAIGSSLWLVPANVASLRDIDALVGWIGSEQTETSGATTTLVKPALLPTLFFPFAAPPVHGSLGADPHAALAQERILLWSVERTIERLAALDSSTDITHRVHVVLPGSPNRGIFGGDGAYAEAKAAFDTIVNKWSTERGWPERVTLAHPRIGWVMGTSLMGANDVLVPAARDAGVHVFTTDEIADLLIDVSTRQARDTAQRAPLNVDLTGGLADAGLDLPALAAAERERARSTATSSTDSDVTATIRALPNLVRPTLAARLPWGEVSTPLHDQVVIVGVGEVGAWGSGRTRNEAETADGNLDLTAAGVLELAWMTGLVRWAESPEAGWYDSDGKLVAEEDVYARFRDEVIARCGIRQLTDRGAIVDAASDDVATVYLDSDHTFPARNADDARAYVDADPSHTRIWFDSTRGEWMVFKRAGSAVRVPRRATLTRSVGGQMPDDFDPSKWGIPASMCEALDRIAVWNLVTTVDAFISSGFTPAELLRAVHPCDVSSTQGTGIGGMESLRKVFLDRFLGEDRPRDILQEALPNVVAAHTMQSYVGGYGQMIHPVGACATAAISIEEGMDKILLGKSDFVIAGGIDDISVESLTGFGDMNATAESAALERRGISHRHFSRAGDRRRGGFLEAEGGGTVLLARGSVAADLGLPVLGVVAYARSFADGAHTSIPAPGLGAVAAARGGTSSAFARALSGLGLTPDDVSVVSKHDTSTRANDPNEAELHATLCRALERSSGAPVHVISQKTVTGHAKGGAALFQVSGLLEVFRDQRIPGNRSLDCLDPQMRPFTPLVWLRRPLDMSATPVRAAVVTSLGFGHVSALIALAHPSAFEEALLRERGVEDATRWRAQAVTRLSAGRSHLERAMIGHDTLFEPVSGRRLPEGEDAHEVEVAMLLDPHARLGDGGVFGL